MLPEAFLTCTPHRDCRAPWPVPRWLQTRFRGKGFAPALRKNSDFQAHGVRFDRFASSDDNYAYVTPVEGKQARRRNAGYKDGAKIYFCNRRSCILTWKRRSCLLYRLSPRESQFQSHAAKMRSVSERRSGHDEPLSAWRSVCDRRRSGDGPRSGALREVHRSEERRVGKECRSRWSPYH